MNRHILSLLALSLLLASVLASCKTRVQYVPVDNVRIEYRDRHTIDSVTTVDTVRIAARGDTVYIERLRYRDKYRMQRDTVLRVDTVTRVQRVEVPISPSFFSRAKDATVGGIGIAAAFLLLLVAARIAFRRYLKR